jgi:hypothetical protein
MLSKALRQQSLEHLLVGLISVLSNLFKHHIPLHAVGVLSQGRIQHKVKQQVEGVLSAAGRHQNVEVHIIKTRSRIAAATKGLNPTIKFAGLQRCTALKHHVF